MASEADILAAMEQHLMPNYGKRLKAMARGRGAKIWDADGREYIDCFAGFGGGGIAGHCHPKIVEAVRKQAETLTCHGNFFTNENETRLAEKLTAHSVGGKVFFCHSGAEADEAALKLTRLAAGPGRYKIISFHGCFHGRTMGGLSLSPAPFQEGFEPMLPGSVKVDFGDIEAAAAAVDDETAGIFVEPIQGEGGLNVPTPEFMQALRKLCDERGLLLVADEVWTGPARTGKWFANEHFGMQPDVVTVAKAVGGGLPLGACIASEKYADTLGPGKHGCTMGGNPLCTAAALAAVELIEQEGLVERAATLGEKAMDALRSAGVPCVADVRGKGMMFGMKLDESVPAKDVFLQAMDAGLLVCLAKQNVLRLAPPLTISEDLLDKAVEILLGLLKSR